MRQDLLDALALREERLEFAGQTVVVREAASAADLGAERGDEDIVYKLAVACVFEADGTTPAMTREDVAHLKAASRAKVGQLLSAVLRVNGMDADTNEGKPQADPAPASSTPSP